MTDGALQVPTLPQRVTLLLNTGHEEEVTIFLGEVAERHTGPETLDDFLNEARRFIVAKKKSGQHALIRRDAIVFLLVESDAPVVSRRDSQTSSAVDLVRVKLDAGSELDGVLLHAAQSGHARLSDSLNDAEDFFPLEIARGVAYINKTHIVSLSL